MTTRCVHCKKEFLEGDKLFYCPGCKSFSCVECDKKREKEQDGKKRYN